MWDQPDSEEATSTSEDATSDSATVPTPNSDAEALHSPLGSSSTVTQTLGDATSGGEEPLRSATPLDAAMGQAAACGKPADSGSPVARQASDAQENDLDCKNSLSSLGAPSCRTDAETAATAVIQQSTPNANPDSARLDGGGQHPHGEMNVDEETAGFSTEETATDRHKEERASEATAASAENVSEDNDPTKVVIADADEERSGQEKTKEKKQGEEGGEVQGENSSNDGGNQTLTRNDIPSPTGITAGISQDVARLDKNKFVSQRELVKEDSRAATNAKGGQATDNLQKKDTNPSVDWHAMGANTSRTTLEPSESLTAAALAAAPCSLTDQGIGDSLQTNIPPLDYDASAAKEPALVPKQYKAADGTIGAIVAKEASFPKRDVIEHVYADNGDGLDHVKTTSNESPGDGRLGNKLEPQKDVDGLEPTKRVVVSATAKCSFRELSLPVDQLTKEAYTSEDVSTNERQKDEGRKSSRQAAQNEALSGENDGVLDNDQNDNGPYDGCDHNNSQVAVSSSHGVNLSTELHQQDCRVAQLAAADQSYAERDSNRPSTMTVEVLGNQQRQNREYMPQATPSTDGQGGTNTSHGKGVKAEDSIDVKPLELASRSPDVDEAIDEKATLQTESTSGMPSMWVFPPSFDALVELLTATSSATCTVEGEIVLAHQVDLATVQEQERLTMADSGDKVGDQAHKHLPHSRTFWQRQYCTYKIAGDGNVPSAEIDLEDDDAQVRLEELLTQEYDLTMDEVLELFPPETDLGSGDAVIQAFANSICQLRPSLLSDHQRNGGDDSGNQTNAVRTAVGVALRGPPAWDEVQVRVHASRVLEVIVFATVVRQEGNGNEKNDTDQESSLVSKPADASHIASSVDCAAVSSPGELKAHLLEAGTPSSAVDVLGRAGLFAGPTIDIADVLATLADEAKMVDPIGHPLPEAENKTVVVPAVCPGNTVRRLCVPLDSGRKIVHSCTVSVTGTPEDIHLEISTGDLVDGDNNTTAIGGAMVMRAHVSCLQTRRVDAFRGSLLPAAASTTQSLHRGLREMDATMDPKLQPGYDKENRCGSTGCPSSVEFVGTQSTGDKNGVETEREVLKIGSQIEARFGGKSAWFSGVVRAIHNSSSVASGRQQSCLPTVAINYDNGNTEEHVPRVRVRLPGQKQPRLLSEGDEVDFRRGRKIALATVVRRSLSKEDQYDLRLWDTRDDSLVENVSRSAIMALHAWPPAR